MRMVLHYHSATHSIGYSVAYMQVKTVEIEGVSRVGFEAVGVSKIGDV